MIKLKYFPVFFFVVFLVLPLRHQRSRSDLGDVLAVATMLALHMTLLVVLVVDMP